MCPSTPSEILSSRKIVWPKSINITDNTNTNRQYPLSVLKLQGFVNETRQTSMKTTSSYSSSENLSMSEYSRQNSLTISPQRKTESSKLMIDTLSRQNSSFQNRSPIKRSNKSFTSRKVAIIGNDNEMADLAFATSQDVRQSFLKRTSSKSTNRLSVRNQVNLEPLVEE